MIPNGAFAERARQIGFEKVYIVRPLRLPNAVKGLAADAYELMPEAKTVILLLKTYSAANASDVNEAVISTYYPASNAAYRMAKRLETELKEKGYRALSNAQLPLKVYLLRYRIGRQGRNSLVYVDDIGSLFHIQAIITDAEFEYCSSENKAYDSRMQECLKCGLCEKMCPTGAIKGFAKIEPTRCLRSVSETNPIPSQYEKLVGNHLLGCDICQTVCPKNALHAMSGAYAFPIKKLLTGDISELKDSIGVNYARKHRLRMKGITIAANMKRKDLLPELRSIMDSSPDADEKRASERAIYRLETDT